MKEMPIIQRFLMFPVKKNMSGTETTNTDIREAFADLIYSNVNGIKALTLAQKIYNSDGEIEFEDSEIEIIKTIADNLCIAKIVDSMHAIIE